MNWRSRWVWWRWTIYGAAFGILGPLLGIAKWSWDNGYVPFGGIAFDAGPIAASILKGAIFFCFIALIHNIVLRKISNSGRLP